MLVEGLDGKPSFVSIEFLSSRIQDRGIAPNRCLDTFLNHSHLLAFRGLGRALPRRHLLLLLNF